MNINHSINSRISFSNHHRCLLVIVILYWVAAVSTGIHGFSITKWHELIDGSDQHEIILGEAQAIRSDDFIAELPLMIAQCTHDPGFPVMNRNIGLGENMLANAVKLPVFHPLTFFRPHVWGFFIGPNTGLAWLWNSYTVGVFYSFFLLAMLFSGNRFFLSLAGAVFFLYSPFVQFWSFHYLELTMFAAFILISLHGIIFSNRKSYMFAHMMVLCWSACGFMLNVYPAYQVPLSYLILFLLIGFILNRYYFTNNNNWRELFLKSSVLVFAGVIVLIIGLYYFSENKEVISITQNTIYPGMRFETGGNFTLQRLFSNLLFPWIRDKSLVEFGNISELGSFLFIFPLIFIIHLYNRIQHKEKMDVITACLFLYIFCMLIYLFVGIPRPVSKYSLMYLVTTNRAVIGIGVANFLLILRYLHMQQDVKSKSLKGFVSLTIFIMIVIFGITMGKKVSGISTTHIFIAGISYGLLTYYFMDQKTKVGSFIVLTVIMMFSTFSFNPVVRNGADFIADNPLSKKILEIEKEKKNTWTTFAPWLLTNYLRMIGVQSINGTQSYPQQELWRAFDPEDAYSNDYNRFGHTTFTAIPNTEKKRILSPFPNQIEVYIHPNDPVFTSLGVDYFLVNQENSPVFDSISSLRRIYSYHNLHIYQTVN